MWAAARTSACDCQNCFRRVDSGAREDGIDILSETSSCGISPHKRQSSCSFQYAHHSARASRPGSDALRCGRPVRDVTGKRLGATPGRSAFRLRRLSFGLPLRRPHLAHSLRGDFRLGCGERPALPRWGWRSGPPVTHPLRRASPALSSLASPTAATTMASASRQLPGATTWNSPSCSGCPR